MVPQIWVEDVPTFLVPHCQELIGTAVSQYPSVQENIRHIVLLFGYGSIPINTIFRGMNIHLPAILMFTGVQGFDTLPFEYHWVSTSAPCRFLESQWHRCIPTSPDSWGTHNEPRKFPRWGSTWANPLELRHSKSQPGCRQHGKAGFVSLEYGGFL